jgi:hypothetical protein
MNKLQSLHRRLARHASTEMELSIVRFCCRISGALANPQSKTTFDADAQNCDTFRDLPIRLPAMLGILSFSMYCTN